MKKTFLYALIISLSLYSMSCGEKDTEKKPISFPEPSLPEEKTFENAFSTYITHQNEMRKTRDVKLDFERKSRTIIEYIKNRQYEKALGFIEEAQRLDSNAFNQLMYYQFKSFCYKASKDKTLSNRELLNFFELYDRIVTHDRNR